MARFNNKFEKKLTKSNEKIQTQIGEACFQLHGKKWFVTATKLGTTNKIFVAATKTFAAATKRFVDRTKHFVVVTKYFC